MTDALPSIRLRLGFGKFFAHSMLSFVGSSPRKRRARIFSCAEGRKGVRYVVRARALSLSVKMVSTYQIHGGNGGPM